MANSRAERVGEQIRGELAELLAREVHDPGIGFITLTGQGLARPADRARLLHDARRREGAARDARRRSQRATPFLRRQIGQRMRLRRVPELEFFYDESIAHARSHRADPAGARRSGAAARPHAGDATGPA